MFSSVTRTFLFLAKTPLIPPPTGPAAVELVTFSSGSSSRPRAASRTFSNLSVRSATYYPSASYAMNNGNGSGRRGMASDHGKKELYSDEAGSVGAGTDDVAHTDAAFNKDANPATAAKGVEQETGKDFTNRSSANPEYSETPGEQGEKGGSAMNTSRKNAGK